MGKRTITTGKVNHAYINPALLTWAITQSGRTRDEIAGTLGVDADVLASWEGSSMPTFGQAVELAEAIGIPFGYLFLSEPPKRKIPAPDKRTLGASVPFSANFRQLLTDVLIRQDWYRQYMRESGAKALTFVGSASPSDGVHAVALSIRRTIKLSTNDRRKGVYSWTDYLARLSRRAEDAGIMVMRSGVVGNDPLHPIARAEVQGFALADPLAPVVFVNASDFVAARIFTLAHELAHIWLGESAISNPEQGDTARLDAIEVFCNQVATELLVPQRAFVVAWRQTPASERVDALVRRYWVSARVILRRAHESGELSLAEYRVLREKAIASEHSEPRHGRPTYFVTAVARAGRRLTDAVVSEVARGGTPIAEGASLLSMNANTFAEFAEGRH